MYVYISNFKITGIQKHSHENLYKHAYTQDGHGYKVMYNKICKGILNYVINITVSFSLLFNI